MKSEWKHLEDRDACSAPIAEGTPSKPLLGRTLVAIGIGGAAFVAFCCIAPLLLAGLLAAIGLGFILKDSVLIGLLVVSLAVTAFGYYMVRRRTHN